jgi:hypothetical protein
MGLLALWAALACHEQPGESPEPGLEPLTEIGTIGVIEGSDGEMFGRIDDVEMGDDGSFFVLDGDAPSVTRVRATGDVVGSYRRTGEGPGEMSRPEDIELMGVVIYERR